MKRLLSKWAEPRQGLIAMALLVLLFSASCQHPPNSANTGSAAKTGSAATERNNLPEPGDWTFAVGGDSRNCGDVMMPAIAKAAKDNNARFYWHLGDFRWMVGIDEDEMGRRNRAHEFRDPWEYWKTAWDDFKTNQIEPFHAVQIPAYVGIGNHESYYPFRLRSYFGKPISLVPSHVDRKDYLAKFSDLMPQGPAEPANGKDVAYYHWTHGGFDFVYLDNADDTKFDDAQLDWLKRVLVKDEESGIHGVVVAMHAALPHSIASDHGMDQTARCGAGENAYEQLAQFSKKTKKPVYLLASHAHYFAKDIYNTAAWQHGDYGVLPGWIIGTAGAERKHLPAGVQDDDVHGSSRYGYLLARVHGTGPEAGTISFEFQPISEVPAAYKDGFTPELVDWCFKENASYRWAPYPQVVSWYGFLYKESKRTTFKGKLKTAVSASCKVQDPGGKPQN